MTGPDRRLRVLVTRAEPDASATAGRLVAMGHDPVILPLFETRALASANLAVPGSARTVAVTSANAIRHAPREMIAALAQAACFCVGGKTARAARQAGFANVIEAGGQAESLAGEIISSAAAHPVVYLCGRVRRPAFEDTLHAAGFVVTAIETYDTVAFSFQRRDGHEFLRGKELDAALVYSVLSAGALSSIADSQDASHLFANATYFCISERVAAVLRARGLQRIIAAAEPTEDSLLSLLGDASLTPS